MPLLESIAGPQDLRGLSRAQLEALASEIRTHLIKSVARTGGHLGPNLGAVELTLAVHRVFDSPRDPIIFDTGHQAYVHKMITGRADRFGTLRQRGGLSGYPSRAESEHDWVESSHASSSLSWGEGMAKAFRLRGEDRTVVVVVGDGALTGGMAWEALNNIACGSDLKMIIVVNDNGRSYTPTVGGLAAQQLSGLRTDRRYEQVLDLMKRSISAAPFGKQAYDVMHGVKMGLKDVLAPQGLFADLGLKYVGPVDGHDVIAVERALQQARHFGGPVIVHCLTKKGKGFAAAEANEEDQFHSVGVIDEVSGEPLAAVVKTTFTDVFGEEIERLAAADERIVALTAAMLHPTGLGRLARSHPDRVFDVGIAEQHAVASAAGLATAGLHPVVAVYSTFLNRAFDQVLMDVALHRLGVTFVLDRAGITGPDGASHHGMWDMAMLAMVPGLRLAAPRDAARLRDALGTATAVDDAPTVVRFSKDPVPDDIAALRARAGMDLLRLPSAQRPPRVLVVSYGAFAPLALEVAGRLEQQGIGATVVDPIWALPINPELITMAGEHELVVTLEDGLVEGGIGEHLLRLVDEAGVDRRVLTFGVPRRFLAHGSRNEVLAECGLTAQEIARAVTEAVAGAEARVEQHGADAPR